MCREYRDPRQRSPSWLSVMPVGEIESGELGLQADVPLAEMRGPVLRVGGLERLGDGQPVGRAVDPGFIPVVVVARGALAEQHGVPGWRADRDWACRPG